MWLAANCSRAASPWRLSINWETGRGPDTNFVAAPLVAMDASIRSAATVYTFVSPLGSQGAWPRRCTRIFDASRLEKPFGNPAACPTRPASRASRPAPRAPLPTPSMSAPHASATPSDDADVMADAAAAAAAQPWRPALVHADVVYNVALGSNMSEAKMRMRGAADRRRIVPLAPPVPCTVPGYALAFDLLGMPPTEPAMAGAVRRRVGDGGALHGVLYKLSR